MNNCAISQLVEHLTVVTKLSSRRFDSVSLEYCLGQFSVILVGYMKWPLGSLNRLIAKCMPTVFGGEF